MESFFFSLSLPWAVMLMVKFVKVCENLTWMSAVVATRIADICEDNGM